MNFDQLNKKFKWLVYNSLPTNGNLLMKDSVVEEDLKYYSHYNDRDYSILVSKFNNRDYNLSKFEKTQFELKQKELLNEIKYQNLNSGTFPSTTSFLNSLSERIDPSNQKVFIEKIKKRLSLYYRWDFFNKNELINKVINHFFLSSTRKLIGVVSLKEHISKNYKSKKRVISEILNGFEILEGWKIKMFFDLYNDNIDLNYPYGNYDWLFRNNLLRSVRIWENKIRINLGQKIIGSFFNEDILFKMITKLFEKKYNVISQGSSEWLRPQKLDVYIPDLNLGIEYQGEQHFRPVDFGGKGKRVSKKQFEENKRRDLRKKELCVKNGLTLIELRYDEDMEGFVNDLKIKYL